MHILSNVVAVRTLRESKTQEITRLLHEARKGAAESAERLMSILYLDLRFLARSVMSSEGPQHTLQPTALVNEAFLRLFQASNEPSPNWRSVQVDWQSRAHFLAVAARQMRLVLIDHARQRRAAKRGGGLRVSLEDLGEISSGPAPDFEVIDQLLTLLASKDAAAARVVELKFFGGMTDREAALVTGTTTSRIRRDWEFARSWLRQRMQAPDRVERV